MTARRAFQFCKQYKRTTEFRRLCEIIRNHLANLNKYKDQRDRPDLSAPESLQLYLDTRFEQLKMATELGLWQEAFRSVEIHGLMSMSRISQGFLDGGLLCQMTARRAFQFCKQYKRTTEFRRGTGLTCQHQSLQLYLDTRFEQLKMATELGLWQEAFRSVEDIHGLMSIVKNTPKASLMVVYYAKLTKIFWISGSHLYHGYSWLKLFTIQKSFNKNLSQKDLQLIASSVILAALSVLPYDQTHGASHLVC
ncbi:Eukaryotic translation initiation factor 3 subunit A [Hibiscus syriacus]|uniref:Eukaryotic translation initiation factor 3 subunit A n=1 Tax=Hibiscus syriacus TaxID=106335 RepID=A0A6A2XH88_HIBSY|nr:Eukaryotic translation initiation factor 3 subunit A [Hibiscus syriacus]